MTAAEFRQLGTPPPTFVVAHLFEAAAREARVHGLPAGMQRAA